jgi:hypothetical protein
MATLENWKQAGCECLIHRYHVAHVCECGKLYPHSQAACDEHRSHVCLNIDSDLVEHGDTGDNVFDFLIVTGLGVRQPHFQEVHHAFAERG